MDKVFGFIKSFLPELLLLLVVGVLLALNVGAFEIDTYTELFHIEAAKETLSAGRFAIPVINGHDYLIRAPFWTWVVMVFFKVLGVSLWAARIPAIICALLGLAFTYMLTLELTKSRFSGFFAATVLGTTWGYFHLGSLSTADILATDIYVGFAWAFLQWHSFAARRNTIQVEMDLFSGVFGALIGLLVLVKGSVAAGLLLLIAGSYLLLTNSVSLCSKLNLGLLLGPAFMIPLPWLFWASVKSGNPLFISDYLLGQPFSRMVGAGPWAKLKPDWLFYAKQLLLGLMPYVVFIPSVLLDSGLVVGRRGHSQEQSWMTWLLIWFGAGVLVYSLSVFHEPSLMLPFYPPLAVLVGYYFGQVMETAGSGGTTAYNGSLVAVIAIMMSAAVLGAVLIFQVVPSHYVSGFWHLPGQAVIESLQLGKHLIELPEAFPLWKFWLIPGPFILLIGGFILFLLQAERRLTATPLTMIITFSLFFLFVKLLYLPVMHRSVPETMALQLNRQVGRNDAVVLYSLHPDIKRVLFYLDGNKIARTRMVRKPDLIAQNLDIPNGTLYGVMREKTYFDALSPALRDGLQVTRYDWKWDTSHLAELKKFLIVRQPQFDKMKSGIVTFRSLPKASLQAMREAAAMEALLANPEEETSAKKRRRR